MKSREPSYFKYFLNILKLIMIVKKELIYEAYIINRKNFFCTLL